jgi:hypothetical protein
MVKWRTVKAGGDAEVDGMLLLEPFLVSISVCKGGIYLSHLAVSNVGVDLLVGEESHVLIRVEAGIGGEGGLLEDVGIAQSFEVLLRPFEHGEKKALFLRGTEGFGMDNHLMSRIYHGHTIIALDDPLRGLHLRGFIVGDVALDRPLLPGFVAMGVKEGADLLHVLWRRLERPLC